MSILLINDKSNKLLSVETSSQILFNNYFDHTTLFFVHTYLKTVAFPDFLSSSLHLRIAFRIRCLKTNDAYTLVILSISASQSL